jgi:hypothetical protein
MDPWGHFFGWVGIIALVLAIPLAVIANLLTPTVRQWWATTSTNRRKKRIKELNERLAEYQQALEQPEVMGWHRVQLFKGISNATITFCTGIYALIAASFIANGWPASQLANSHKLTGMLLVAGAMLILGAAGYLSGIVDSAAHYISPESIGAAILDVRIELKKLGVDNSE